MSIELNKSGEQEAWMALDPETASVGVEAKKKIIGKVVGTPLMYWSGHVANWTYVLTLFVIGTLAVDSENWLRGGAYFLSGFVAWGFSEYIFHRWAYHKNESFFAVGHLMHHDDTQALIGMPWLVNMLSLSGLFLLFTFFLGRMGSAFLFSGFWLGHIWYTIVHHGIHHWDISHAWFKKLKHHHKIHHKMPDRNLGVTMIFWDRIFKTRV
jgi:sterol desaturase/sphingolipid hydroxylase (fatty acid hydroxylase superfamily)